MTAPWRFLPCDNCCEVRCLLCAGGAPDRFEVTIQGIRSNSCPNCPNLNGTYILRRSTTVKPPRCSWYYEFEHPYEYMCIARPWLGLSLSLCEGASLWITLEAGWGYYVYWTTYGTPLELPCNNTVNCHAIDVRDIPFAYADSYFSNLCDFSSSTVSVRSLP
jgi:hypothetical protein